MTMLYLAILCLCALGVQGDTPAVCYYDDILGTWDFYETERIYDASISCDGFTSSDYVIAKQFTFEYPNVATDADGNTGTWTMISSQGFEVNINERSYFAFSYYEGDFSDSVSYCDQIVPGWSRDTTVRNWSCYNATKTTPVDPRTKKSSLSAETLLQRYVTDHEMVEKINTAQTSWKAKAYPHFEKFTIRNMLSLGGGLASEGVKLPEPIALTEEQLSRTIYYPENFDWRDISGIDYVSPVRDQGSCGSCYAFSSMAGLASRLRLSTQNGRTDVFSVQDVMDCSKLSQGCDGGFKYLIAGRYAQDQGVIAEELNPYTAADGATCSRPDDAVLTYVSDYDFTGGYYGGCNEALIMDDLLLNGPMPISYYVYSDFYLYESGIYVHTETRSDFNPHVPTNHAVLLVGYGVDEETGMKYWTCQNSWGADWGESGYFKIRRGTNECSIESVGFGMTVIP